MKGKILLGLIVLTANFAVAQKKFSVGPYYTLGTSTIMSSVNSMNMNGSMMYNGTNTNPDVSFKFSFGTGVRAETFFDEHWGFYLQTGYQQRGGMFKQYMDDYKPRYKLNYWDVNAGVQFKTKGIVKRHQFIINLGLTQHTLLNGSRVYDTGSDNMNGDFRSIDFGGFLSVGTNVPVLDKDLFQLQLFVNQGFSQIYTGNMGMNNMSGRNFLIGIQIGYQIGKPEKR